MLKTVSYMPKGYCFEKPEKKAWWCSDSEDVWGRKSCMSSGNGALYRSTWGRQLQVNYSVVVLREADCSSSCFVSYWSCCLLLTFKGFEFCVWRTVYLNTSWDAECLKYMGLYKKYLKSFFWRRWCKQFFSVYACFVLWTFKFMVLEMKNK